MAYLIRRRSGLSTILVALYVAAGLWVASSHHYFRSVDGVKDIVSAALAVVLWPLVLVGVNLRVK